MRVWPGYLAIFYLSRLCVLGLLSYYSAFCSAANKIATVLSEFDQFMNERFNINWYCLHQRMFFQYFFMVATVQSKVCLFNQVYSI